MIQGRSVEAMSTSAHERSVPHGLAELRLAMATQKFAAEGAVVRDLLASCPYDESTATAIEFSAAELVSEVRADRRQRTLLDRFLKEYGLDNQEGIALMCLAEALLRIPDKVTADRLIADKIVPAEWASHFGRGDGLLVNASTWALMLTGRVVTLDRSLGKDPSAWLRQLVNKIGEPTVRQAMRHAMRILGNEFVLGQSIEKAIRRSKPGQPYSYDMLGEAARDSRTAARYYEDYAGAISAVAGIDAESARSARSSVSVKLSALHPRYEEAQRTRVLAELGDRMMELCRHAAQHDVDLTIDAEEADRLELSLDIFQRLAEDDSLSHWPGLGIVVQAYGKRAPLVIEWLAELARQTGRRIPVRLVKGAYWDAEIKHAQVSGFPGFPVFTRKASTDLSYLACARKLLDSGENLSPQFATHNAHTIAAVMAIAGERRELEFQRLHGMGEALYKVAHQRFDRFPPVRIYAPVGVHEDLLAYLVRRLLENGANSSFVNRLLDEQASPDSVVEDPVRVVRDTTPVEHPAIALPNDLFGSSRQNSPGVDLSDREVVANLKAGGEAAMGTGLRAAPIIFGRLGGGSGSAVVNPADTREKLGECVSMNILDINRAFDLAKREQRLWDAAGADARAGVMEAVADGLQENQEKFVAILGKEAGKTLPDAVAEVREAIDFCRYYAVQARALLGESVILPGPAGESNLLSLHGRGVFVCVSPWNFPLAIFVGQISAALVSGNAVLAKPAEETPLVATEAVKLMHAAGVPVNALQLVTGDGAVGAELVSHPKTDGVAFTGSTSTAQKINLALAARNAPIAPLIAETGGQNAMIVDSTALLEQVTDDVVQSAFLSAGQRCSALRVLYLQDDIADKAIRLISGAMDELSIGDPTKIETDVGPIISAAAAADLQAHVDSYREKGPLLHEAKLSEACEQGYFVAPCMIEIEKIEELDKEHFGPILHVIRYPAKSLERIVEDITNTGFGLTFGIHSRINSRAEQLFSAVPAGNTYVNRNMTGAVVGSQPFGGHGLSGTGPKAGGPHYLYRFITEKVLTVNTAAAGGNADLLSLSDTSPADI